MTFKRAQWSLRLYIRPRKDRVMREIFGVGCEKPHCGVCIEHPVPPALGVAEFWLEGPAIGADVDQFRWVILACSECVSTHLFCTEEIGEKEVCRDFCPTIRSKRTCCRPA